MKEYMRSYMSINSQPSEKTIIWWRRRKREVTRIRKRWSYVINPTLDKRSGRRVP